MDKKAFLYKRKSSESDDRQAPSLESQDRAIKELIPDFSSYEIVASFEEAKSAKIPDNRPQFTEMIERLEKSEAEYVICWALNRLARNAREAGILIDLVQRHHVKIVTPYKTYDGDSEVGAMYSEFSTSNTFIIDLTRNTKRGTNDKLMQGKAPVIAPIGYRNTPEKKQGLRDIQVDDDTFPLVRKMWDMLLTGQSSPAKILRIATNDWGLRRRNGKPISKSKIYDLFSNIFYTGKYYYFGGILHSNGVHTPMITVDEFDLAQKILGRKGKPRIGEHEFSFTKWLRCKCLSAIVADERLIKRCPKTHCRYKFNAINEICPKCKTTAPDRIKYICRYYCKKTKNPNCKQPSIRVKELERQIDEFLETLELPEDYARWVMKKLRKENEEESSTRQIIDQSLNNTRVGVVKKLDNLLSKYLSEENSTGEIISEEQYLSLKRKLETEKKNLEEQIKEISKRQDTWLDTAEKAFNFAVHARYWFKHGTKEQKRAIAMCVGRPPLVDGGFIKFDTLKPFIAIQKIAKVIKEKKVTVDPLNQPQYEAFLEKSFVEYRVRESNP